MWGREAIAPGQSVNERVLPRVAVAEGVLGNKCDVGVKDWSLFV